MKHLTSSRSLEQYGINYLTGEACAYSMRALCDLSERGVQLMRSFWGLSSEVTFNSNWNSKVNGEPAVASVMLSRNVWQDLMRFALIHVDRVDYILQDPDGGLIGFMDGEEYANEYLGLAAKDKRYNLWRNYNSGPRVGDRNVHQFSGRAS